MAAVQCGSHGLACLILQPVLKHQVQEGIIRKQGAEGAISTWKNLLLPPPKHEVGKKEVSELQNKKIQTFGWGCALPVSSSRSFCLCLQFKLCFIDCDNRQWDNGAIDWIDLIDSHGSKLDNSRSEKIFQGNKETTPPTPKQNQTKQIKTLNPAMIYLPPPTISLILFCRPRGGFD